jgi:hypothetical protein
LASDLTTLASQISTISALASQLGIDVTALDQIVVDLNAIKTSLLSGVIPSDISATLEGDLPIEGLVQTEEDIR